eukprot:9843320-Alexandrium_andersonii.AAC.1
MRRVAAVRLADSAPPTSRSELRLSPMRPVPGAARARAQLAHPELALHGRGRRLSAEDALEGAVDSC